MIFRQLNGPKQPKNHWSPKSVCLSVAIFELTYLFQFSLLFSIFFRIKALEYNFQSSYAMKKIKIQFIKIKQKIESIAGEIFKKKL